MVTYTPTSPGKSCIAASKIDFYKNARTLRRVRDPKQMTAASALTLAISEADCLSERAFSLVERLGILFLYILCF